MKTSGSMIGGNLKPEAYAPLASYFVKYIQAYQAQGLTVNYLTAQNEPLFIPPSYPGMGMAASEQANFIKNNLGPALVTNHLSTKILAYDHNWDAPNYPQSVLTDAAAAQYISGVAWHWYGGDAGAQTTVHDQFAGKDAFITEASGGTWQGGDANGLNEALKLVINGSRNWTRGVGSGIWRWIRKMDQQTAAATFVAAW
jgi:glucosylceramidase